MRDLYQDILNAPPASDYRRLLIRLLFGMIADWFSEHGYSLQSRLMHHWLEGSGSAVTLSCSEMKQDPAFVRKHKHALRWIACEANGWRSCCSDAGEMKFLHAQVLVHAGTTDMMALGNYTVTFNATCENVGGDVHCDVRTELYDVYDWTSGVDFACLPGCSLGIGHPIGGTFGDEIEHLWQQGLHTPAGHDWPREFTVTGKCIDRLDLPCVPRKSLLCWPPTSDSGLYWYPPDWPKHGEGPYWSCILSAGSPKRWPWE
jgi:hypothetical protein